MPAPFPKASKAARGDGEEVAVLKSLNVDTIDRDKYESAVLDSEGVSTAAAEEEAAVIYGSSAPGFVRSKKYGNVIEVDKSQEGAEKTEQDVAIAIKLERTDSPEREEDALTESELRTIQVRNIYIHTSNTSNLIMLPRTSQKRLAAAGNTLIAERARQDRMSASVSDQMYADCQELLQMFGLPWIVAPSEAEAQCAFLDMVGMSDGCVTEDSDVWLFGGQRVFKNFFNQDKHCESYSATEIGKHLGLSREKMILLAMLTGSDYTDGVDNVGPVTAMEIIAEFPGQGLQPLKDFSRWWREQKQSSGGAMPVGNKNREKFRKLHLPESFPNDRISEAYLSPSVDNSTEAFSWAVPNFVEIRDFAQEKFGWTRGKVDELIKPVIKRFDERVTQAKIDRYFFSDRVSLPTKEGHLMQNSKRVQSAVDRVLGRTIAASEESVPPKRAARKSATTTNAESKPTTSSGHLPSRKEAEEARKKEAKEKAVAVWKKDQAKNRKGKKRAPRRGPKRIVMEAHNLSESDDSD